MKQWRLSTALALVCLAPAVDAAQLGGASGYATVGAPSGATPNLPTVYAPASNSFSADLDLPDLSRYQHEIFRFVRGGLVVQFAVVAPGKPVQVMALLASPRPPWTLRSPRRFGWLSWSDYLELRSKILPAILTAPPAPSSHIEEVCLDGGGGEIGYSAGLPNSPNVEFAVGCQAADPSQTAVMAMIGAAKHALGSQFPAHSSL